ncbi:MAG TPA: arginine deiminase-related protein [Nitrospiria bacterium]
MPKFLMCPPEYYQIEYEINAWMDKNRQADAERARDQWHELYETLTARLGAEVELMSPVKGLPDLVFTANAGLVAGREFMLSRFRYPERQREAPVFESWFKERGYQIHSISGETCFEGEGDALTLGETLFAGYQKRSDIQSHTWISGILKKRVLSLALIDPYFYHLDTCFFPLDAQTAFYFPDAFDDYGRRVIADAVPEAVPVSKEDAMRFGCNAVVVGRNIVLQKGCTGMTRVIEEKGFTVHELDLSEFHKAGGSAKCLVLRLS